MPLPESLRAVVTGAGSGLGRAFCTRLAARGARVLAADIHLEGAKATAAALAGSEVHPVAADVSRLADVEALAVEAEQRFGGTDLVINNAGVAVAGPVGEVPVADWEWILGVNLAGVIWGCHVFVPRLRRQGAGHVINVASAAGLLNPPQMAPYNVTKGAVIALSETLAQELVGSGVGCTVLCPSFFPTNIGRNARATDPRTGAMVEKMMRRSPFSADDVAEIALQAAAHDQLYSVPHAEARWAWRLKRAMPERYVRLGAKAMGAIVKRLGG